MRAVLHDARGAHPPPHGTGSGTILGRAARAGFGAPGDGGEKERRGTPREVIIRRRSASWLELGWRAFVVAAAVAFGVLSSVRAAVASPRPAARVDVRPGPSIEWREWSRAAFDEA